MKRRIHNAVSATTDAVVIGGLAVGGLALFGLGLAAACAPHVARWVANEAWAQVKGACRGR